MSDLIVSSSDQDEAFVAERVETWTAWGYNAADALVEAAGWDEDGQSWLAARYREVARRLQAVEDADLVYV